MSDACPEESIKQRTLKHRQASCKAQTRLPSPESCFITLQTERPVYGGTALGRHDGKVCFVEGAIPGERVRARITEEKNDYCRAATVAVLDPSPDRITPPCPLYGTCGGCQQQHIAYHRQISLKQEILTDTLHRIGKLDVTLAEPLADEQP
ncbi:MAG: TRAM domain-containing protein, partial [Nitrospiraceae bacterium]|nr:TRAM domain-containing protein [Nitrospiraceae bacterium]